MITDRAGRVQLSSLGLISIDQIAASNNNAISEIAVTPAPAAAEDCSIQTVLCFGSFPRDLSPSSSISANQNNSDYR